MRAMDFWRRRRLANVALGPAALAFAGCVFARRALYRLGWLRSEGCGAPVVVVGNVVAGGGGKTPAVVALALELRRRGLNPGVVSRGFGGARRAPGMVADGDDWRAVGDEPLLIRRRAGAPVCVGRDRAAAARMLVDAGCDVVISDDGLQHYAMRRDMEICVINGDYQFGNGWPLPAGPLREGRRRAFACDAVLVVGGAGGGDSGASLGGFFAPTAPGRLFAPGAPEKDLPADFLRGKKVAAVAGIARPAAFFAALAGLGAAPAIAVPLADHGRLSDSALAALDADVVVMTEKDAVKYPPDDPRLCALALDCRLPAALIERVMKVVAPAQ